MASSGTPYFAFKDLDENKAAGLIGLRVDTIDYFLTRHRAALVAREEARADIYRRLAELERTLQLTSAAGMGAAGPHEEIPAP